MLFTLSDRSYQIFPVHSLEILEDLTCVSSTSLDHLSVSCLLHIFWCFVVRQIHTKNAVFLEYWSLYHYMVPFTISYKFSCSEDDSKILKFLIKT